ncbi:mandelate racemase/muconate lactonizing enzyme family protein [Chloroflexota bacterium]
MKIISVEPIVCEGRTCPWVFAKITTDDGIVGYGDCTKPHFGTASIAVLVSELGNSIIGQDPFEIEKIYWSYEFWARSSQRTVGYIAHTAIAGIDSALWDIKGKALGVPVYQLLGGKMRDSIPLYWTHCASTRAKIAEKIGVPPVKTLDDIRHLSEQVLAEGFTALKTNLIPLEDCPLPGSLSFTNGHLDRQTLRNAVTIMETFRKSVGEDVGIALDVGFSFRMGGNIELAQALEPYNLMWLEVETWDPQALRTIRTSTKTHICTGERILTTRGYRPFLEEHAQDVIMPDIGYIGLTMGKKIADMSEVYDVMFAPHNCHSPLGTVITAHLCATVCNFMIMEFDRDDVPWRDDILTEPLRIENGNLILPEGPGLGVDLNEKEIAKHKTQF